MIQVNISNASFNQQFTELIGKVKKPAALLLVLGRELANQLKKHFRTKDATEPNKLSPRRQHFWLQIGRSVQNPEVEAPKRVSVAINDPRFAQKLFGGTIRAKRARALTIPVSEQAYGRTASTFEAETGLKLFPIKIGGTKANRLENAVLAAKVGSGIEVEYILTKSVSQKPDQSALPDEKELEAALLKRGQAYLDRELLGGKQP